MPIDSSGALFNQEPAREKLSIPIISHDGLAASIAFASCEPTKPQIPVIKIFKMEVVSFQFLVFSGQSLVARSCQVGLYYLADGFFEGYLDIPG
jgi:hypothetical protein